MMKSQVGRKGAKKYGSNISNLHKSNLEGNPSMLSRAEERKQLASNMGEAIKELKRKQVGCAF